MFDFLRPTAQDLKVAAQIERKRQVEEARRSRIFNPRIRRIGVDKQFLDKQIEEKKRQQELEREEERLRDEALIRFSQLGILLQKQRDEERRKINQEVDEFRQTYQKPELRRDFDLYDPERQKKLKPPRECDDENLGPASAQKFEGEDIQSAERLREQREQMQSWIVQQVEERRRAERERRESERAHQEALLSRDKRALTLERMELECRRQLNKATASFNLALAQAQEDRRRQQALQDDEDKRAEIYNHVTGDFLNESKDQALSRRGPCHPLANRYKGMTSMQIKTLVEDQAKQMEEAQRLKVEEQEKNQEWNRIMNTHARAAESQQREIDRKRAELSKQIEEENKRLAQEQKSHQEYLNRCVYKHKPSSEFYAQFNKSTR